MHNLSLYDRSVPGNAQSETPEVLGDGPISIQCGNPGVHAGRELRKIHGYLLDARRPADLVVLDVGVQPEDAVGVEGRDGEEHQHVGEVVVDPNSASAKPRQ